LFTWPRNNLPPSLTATKNCRPISVLFFTIIPLWLQFVPSHHHPQIPVH
jgi:hypothetical protein